MLISNLHSDFHEISTNPTVMVTKGFTKRQYDFPDERSYFILSNAGKEYSVNGNVAILLNLQKGYFASSFNIGSNQDLVVLISNEMFKGSVQLPELPTKALNLAIRKSAKDKPSLPSRL